MTPAVPHIRVVVAVTAFVLAGFLGVSAYVLGWSTDLTTKGNIIGTWVNFAMLAVGFWLGSSSAGKAKGGDPQPVTVENPPSAPVPTYAGASPETAAARDELPGQAGPDGQPPAAPQP